MDIASWLVRQLNAHGLKQAEVARAVGVTDKSVSNWVHGVHPPSRENLKKLEEFLGAHTKRAEIVYPPFRASSGCYRCHHLRRCRRRVGIGFPVMCEGLTAKDLRWAEKAGCLDLIIWWKPCESINDLDLA